MSGENYRNERKFAEFLLQQNQSAICSGCGINKKEGYAIIGLSEGEGLDPHNSDSVFANLPGITISDFCPYQISIEDGQTYLYLPNFPSYHEGYRQELDKRDFFLSETGYLKEILLRFAEPELFQKYPVRGVVKLSLGNDYSIKDASKRSIEELCEKYICPEKKLGERVAKKRFFRDAYQRLFLTIKEEDDWKKACKKGAKMLEGYYF